MGVISETIRKKLEEDIRSKGLLVWLDKEGEFSGLVDEWVDLYRKGKFTYPIFAFRGSFLELMLESRTMLAGKDMPKCVIHMPGFNEQEIKDTPFYEAYKAGQRWRISLATMIRECAQGRLPPDRTESLLVSEKLDLAYAEKSLLDLEEAPSEIRRLLNRHGEDGLVLGFLEDPAGMVRGMEAEPRACHALLGGHFLKLLGLDEEWRKAWNKHGADDDRQEDLADLLMSYLLCLEYVWDLTVEAPSGRLLHLRNKPKEFQAKAVLLLQEMRRKNPQTYIKWADRIQASLTGSETALGPEALGQLDSFRFEADIFVREALRLLGAGQWENALRLAETRLPGRRGEGISQTFWLTQDMQRQWLWEWINAAARLGTRILNVQVPLAPERGITIEDLGRSYAETGWELDRLHRRFVVVTERYTSGNALLEFDSVIGIRKTLNRLYRAVIDSQARLWNGTCRQSGFLGPVGSRQRHFFRQWVKPRLGAERRTALILVDALRYELGKELAEILEGEDLGKIGVEALFAELPTITAVGMNALVPTGDGATLTPVFDAKGSAILGFKSGQRRVLDPETRERTLRESAGVDTAWTTLDAFLKEDAKQTRKLTANPLLVITALDIDAMGESGALAYGIDCFEKGLGRIKTAVRKLKDSGYESIVIATDHGFLLGDESLETGRAARLVDADRRYAIDTERNGENLVSVGFAELDYLVETAGTALVFERSTHLLNSRSAGGFYHGGNSLQERLIPVITVTLNRVGQKEKGSYALAIVKQAPLLGFQHLRVTASARGTPELFAKESIEVRMAADAGAEVKIGDAGDARVTGDLVRLAIGKPCDIFFKLTGTVAKAQIRFEPTQAGNLLDAALSGDYFDVDHHALEASPAAQGADFSADIPAEYHAALHHLRKHGSLSEKFLRNTLGNDGSAPRKARQFAAHISEWVKFLPFNVKVELTPEGKEYRTC